MKNYFITIFIFFFIACLASETVAQPQRFPMPEFQTEYQKPEASTPEPRAASMEYVDLFVLISVLAFTIWLIFKKRSRRWILWVSVFALLYFGFYRLGCICAIGSVQNITLALFNTGYAIPLTVLAFFAIPLLVALFAGRVFCATACPLGVIQDLVIFKPVKLAPWLQKALGLFPFIYLGLAVLFAATATDFIICRYDPFVGIFRMSAELHMIILGIGILLLGMFVARPFCRFICPYGALLRVFSKFSRFHLSITPKDCIKCHLCKDSCPFDAIDKPTDEKEIAPDRKKLRKFVTYAALIPVFVFVGGWLISGTHKTLAKAHPDVYLANLLVENPELMNDTDNVDIETFMTSDRTLEMLVEDAIVIQNRFRYGGWYLGGFIGLVIGISLLSQTFYKKRTIYEANREKCYSCGRCMKYCPVGNELEKVESMGYEKHITS